jgi:hypothetical protein
MEHPLPTQRPRRSRNCKFGNLYYFLRHYCRRPQIILVHGSAEGSPPSTLICHQRRSGDPRPPSTRTSSPRHRMECCRDADPPHPPLIKEGFRGSPHPPPPLLRDYRDPRPPSTCTSPPRRCMEGCRDADPPHPPLVKEGNRGSPTLLPLCSAITGIRGRHQHAPAPHEVAWKVAVTPIRPTHRPSWKVAADPPPSSPSAPRLRGSEATINAHLPHDVDGARVEGVERRYCNSAINALLPLYSAIPSIVAAHLPSTTLHRPRQPLHTYKEQMGRRPVELQIQPLIPLSTFAALNHWSPTSLPP